MTSNTDYIRTMWFVNYGAVGNQLQWVSCRFQAKRPNYVVTTPITAMVCRQCLPLSVVQLKSKHCQNPHCRNGVVDR